MNKKERIEKQLNALILEFNNQSQTPLGDNQYFKGMNAGWRHALEWVLQGAKF